VDVTGCHAAPATGAAIGVDLGQPCGPGGLRRPAGRSGRVGELGAVHGTQPNGKLAGGAVAKVFAWSRSITRALEEKAQIGIGLLGPDTYAIRKDIAESASTRRFPIVMDTPGGNTDMGGVATVGVNIVPYYRRGAVEQMIPMLQGKRPSDLSWIGPKQVDVIVNEEVARSFGLMVPTVPR